ncbi:hypothetical protein, partial [Salmonella sp. s54925]|uniref:hypothetical protein n=1 Tax=Salmonella sp. s54925 TaxID=3159674 RepID=UPI0039809D5C
RNVLITHLTYFGFATLVFVREVFVEYSSNIGLALVFHFLIFLITLCYTTKLRQVNQPIPDKPVSFADSDDGGM